MERRFAESFAAFLDIPFAVPVCNGSAALTVALEALSIGAGDEVLVPALGWVACCSAVVAVGADPVIVDVDPHTLGMDPGAAAAAITSRTRGIILVHYLGAPADIQSFQGLSEREGVPLIEDASQAHGARLNGQALGTFGAVGVFSLQQGKLLTSGEGGVAVTRHERLYDRLQQLRADGRAWRLPRVPGLPELEERSDLHGHNYVMSAFQAAVALAGLQRLDKELERRRRSAERLSAELLEGGIASAHRIVHTAEHVVHWRYAFELRGWRRPKLADAGRRLARLLNCDVYGLELPMPRHPLYRPQRTRRRVEAARLDPDGVQTPEADRAYDRLLTLPHRIFLAEPERMTEVADAVAVVAKRR